MPRVIAIDQLQQFTAVQLLSDPGAIGGPVVIPQCAQVALKFVLDDAKLAHCVLVGRYAGTFAGSVAQANAIHTALSTGAQWTALAAFLAAAPTSFAGVEIRDVNTPNNPVIASTTTAQPGTSASPALPNEVALAATLRTNLTGKANRGRFYLPGWATNALGTGNVVAQAAITAYQNWCNTVMGAFSSNGYTLVVGQRARAAYIGSTGTSHPARPAGSVSVTQIQVRDNHWDSQRRRGLK